MYTRNVVGELKSKYIYLKKKKLLWVRSGCGNCSPFGERKCEEMWMRKVKHESCEGVV